MAEQRTLLSAAGKRAGWDDPEMDLYDREEAAPEQTSAQASAATSSTPFVALRAWPI